MTNKMYGRHSEETHDNANERDKKKRDKCMSKTQDKSKHQVGFYC